MFFPSVGTPAFSCFNCDPNTLNIQGSFFQNTGGGQDDLLIGSFSFDVPSVNPPANFFQSFNLPLSELRQGPPPGSDVNINSGFVDLINVVSGPGPTANDDFYTTTGNVLLDVDATNGVLDNDLPAVGNISVTDFDAVSFGGGDVSVNPDGSFTYNPPAGFEGADHFLYEITDDGNNEMAVALAFLDVSDMIWFIDDTAASGGTGRFTDPFDTIVPVNGAAGAGDMDDPGDTIFLFEGSGTTPGNLPLENNQSFIGNGVDLIVNNDLIVPAGTRPMFTSNGNNTITLASGNTVRGLDVSSTNGGAIVGTNFGTFTADNFDIDTTNGSGLVLGNGNINVQGGTLTISNIGSSGLDGVSIDLSDGIVDFDNISAEGGTTAVRVTNSPGINFGATSVTVNNNEASEETGVFLNGNLGANFNFGDLDVTTTGDGIFLDDFSSFRTLAPTGSTINSGGSAFVASNGGLDATFDSITSGGGSNGINLDTTTGTFTVGTNTSITDPTVTGISVTDSDIDADFGDTVING